MEDLMIQFHQNSDHLNLIIFWIWMIFSILQLNYVMKFVQTSVLFLGKRTTKLIILFHVIKISFNSKFYKLTEICNFLCLSVKDSWVVATWVPYCASCNMYGNISARYWRPISASLLVKIDPPLIHTASRSPSNSHNSNLTVTRWKIYTLWLQFTRYLIVLNKMNVLVNTSTDGALLLKRK